MDVGVGPLRPVWVHRRSMQALCKKERAAGGRYNECPLSAVHQVNPAGYASGGV